MQIFVCWDAFKGFECIFWSRDRRSRLKKGHKKPLKASQHTKMSIYSPKRDFHSFKSNFHPRNCELVMNVVFLHFALDFICMCGGKRPFTSLFSIYSIVIFLWFILWKLYISSAIWAGLVDSIPDSQSADPGSIPGLGILFFSYIFVLYQ